jgi:hypothetical protein
MLRLCWLAALAACSIPNDRFHPSGGGDGGGGGGGLAFVAPPTRGFAVTPLATIKVAITDDTGMPVPTATDEITLAIGDNSGGANLLGTLTVSAVAGVAEFALVGLDRTGAGYTLVASATGFAPVTSAAFDITAPPFTLLSTGIYGGHIDTVAVSPAPVGGSTMVFAGMSTGVYKSTNNGATWSPASFGFANAAGTLVADPKNPGVVYAVQADSGGGVAGATPYFLKKTVSGGATWIDAGGPTLGQGATVAIDPSNSSIIYVGGTSIYRSTNAGASWTKLTGLPYECPKMAIDPVNASMYCAAYDRPSFTDQGVYKSIDGGATWAAVNTGLSGLVVRSLLVATPNATFVEASNILYRSTNGGGNWTSLNINFPYALAYAPSRPTRMYLSLGSLGVAVSNDAGASFGTAVVVGDVVQVLAVDPNNPDQVYAAGRDNGVYVSSNGGTSWALASVGIATRTIGSVAMNPGAPDTVVVSAEDGVYQTANAGTSWSRTSTATGILDFDPAQPGHAYLCGDSFFTSINSGASFSQGGATGTGCRQLAFAGATMYAAGFPGGLHKSINTGGSWATTGFAGDFTYSVALGDTTGAVVVIGSNQGTYRSTDGGTNFSQINLEIADSLLTDPTTPTRIISGLSCGSSGSAMSSGGFRISTDGGASFGSVIAGPCVSQLTSNGAALFAAGRPFSAVSTDQGATWRRLGVGVPAGAEMTSIAASADGKTIYLGTTAGLFKSTTGGL